MPELYPLRFQPIFRRYVWGGRRLESVLGKPLGEGGDYAESWEIVDHGDDQSVVTAGAFAGTTLNELVTTHGQELLGMHDPQARFPLLFKLLDAHRALSVQVHPDDTRAAKLDPPDLGKTEAWVVLHADPGSLIYAGLKRGFDREALAREGSVFFPMVVLLASPIFVGLAMVSEEVIAVLLGQTWIPAAPITSILAIAALLITPSVANEPLLTMTGKIRALPPVALFNAGIAVLTLLVFTQFGIVAAAFARLGASAVLMISSVWLQNRHAQAPWWETMKQATPVYSALMGLVASVLFTRLLLDPYAIALPAQLLIEVFTGAAAYFIIILFVRPSYLRTTLWL